MFDVFSSILENFSSALLLSTMVTAGLLFSFLSFVGTFWCIPVTLELIPQRIRHWLLFPFAIGLGIGIPYIMLFSGYVEFLTLAFTNSSTPLPVFLLVGMIGSILMGTIGTAILGASRSLHTIEWLQKSFENKMIFHSNTRGTRYAINTIYMSVALALLSSCGILLSDIQISSSFFMNYTFLYGIGGGLTYIFSQKIQQPVEMIALPSLASGSPYFGIGLWFLSKILSVIGCITFGLGLVLLPNVLQFDNWFGLIFGMGMDVLLLSLGLIFLKLGDNRGKLRRLRLGIEKSNILNRDYVPKEDENNLEIENEFLDKDIQEEEILLKKKDLEFLNRDM